jgi:transposase
VTLTMADMATSPAGQDGTVGSGDGPRSGRPKRRAFTAEYKMRILRQYEELADDPQARGALLRREGLYTSHLSEWRKVRDASAEISLADKPSGRPRRSAAEAENERLRKENERLTAELARTKAALDVVGKAHALLELLSESADSSAKRQK